MSAPRIRGHTDEVVGSVRRVPAQDIEIAISEALIANAAVSVGSQDGTTFSRNTVEAVVGRIEVRKKHLAVHLKLDQDEGPSQIESPDDAAQPSSSNTRLLLIPWEKPSALKTILRPAEARSARVRSIKPEQRSSLIRSISLGRHWLQQIVDGTTTVTQLAAEHDCTIRQVNMTISLAFLAPSLVTAAVQGGLPRGVSVTSLRDAPPEWSKQVARLGLAPITPR